MLLDGPRPSAYRGKAAIFRITESTMAYRGFLRPGRSGLVKKCVGHRRGLIVDLPRWRAFVATALPAAPKYDEGGCRRAGENAIYASTQLRKCSRGGRGSYSVKASFGNTPRAW